jgi:hypothetical protein
MDELSIKAKLDMLADLRSAADVLSANRQDLIDSVLGQELKGKLTDIDTEFSTKIAEANEKATALEAEVKQAIIDHGASVKGAYIHAIWVKGRESWDGKLLSGFAIAHPEILTARKVGDPSVSLRAVK